MHSVVVSGKGSAKPFEETQDTVYATVKISTIDYNTRVVTFTLPSGEKQKVKENCIIYIIIREILRSER